MATNSLRGSNDWWGGWLWQACLRTMFASCSCCRAATKPTLTCSLALKNAKQTRANYALRPIMPWHQTIIAATNQLTPLSLIKQPIKAGSLSALTNTELVHKWQARKQAARALLLSLLLLMPILKRKHCCRKRFRSVPWNSWPYD